MCKQEQHLENSTQTVLHTAVTSICVIGSSPIKANRPYSTVGSAIFEIMVAVDFIRLLYSVRSDTVEDGYFDYKMLYD